ncbi:MAG: ankyrin repeat domain-containing protein [Bdellovibrionales bacterium]|nr:ankyrin repeat domain-containing protein [Bdellovibrionales bacterium]
MKQSLFNRKIFLFKGSSFLIALVLINFSFAEDARDINGITALHQVVIEAYINFKKVDLEDVLNLINLSEVNAKNNYGETALHLATKYGNEEIAELLLKNKADVNATDNRGKTALHHAFGYGIEMETLFIENGTLVYVTDNKGQTVLDFAIKDNKPELEKLL